MQLTDTVTLPTGATPETNETGAWRKQQSGASSVRIYDGSPRDAYAGKRNGFGVSIRARKDAMTLEHLYRCGASGPYTFGMLENRLAGSLFEEFLAFGIFIGVFKQSV